MGRPDRIRAEKEETAIVIYLNGADLDFYTISYHSRQRNAICNRLVVVIRQIPVAKLILLEFAFQSDFEAFEARRVKELMRLQPADRQPLGIMPRKKTVDNALVFRKTIRPKVEPHELTRCA